MLQTASKTVLNAATIKHLIKNYLVYFRLLCMLDRLSIYLLGPLPEAPSGEKWIFIVQDRVTKWVEFFPLKEARTRECATTLLEVALGFGLH